MVSPHYYLVGGVNFPQGEGGGGSAVIHRRKTDLLHKDVSYVCVTDSGRVRLKTGSRPPRAQCCSVDGVKFPHGEGSAVTHRDKSGFSRGCHISFVLSFLLSFFFLGGWGGGWYDLN